MPTQVCLSFKAEDRIFLGEGLFETIRISKGEVCHGDLHWHRLNQSASQIGICFDVSVEAWQRLLEENIEASNVSEGGIKVILSGGPAPRGLTQKSMNSQLLFQTFEYQLSHKPIRLKRASWVRDPANSLYQIKSVNYLEAILARKEAEIQGFDDALFFNIHSHATETTCANFFIIKNNEIATPKLEDGLLAGITRKRIFLICEKLGVSIHEKSLSLSEIIKADSLFITNSLQGIQEVAVLDEKEFMLDHPLIGELRKYIQ